MLSVLNVLQACLLQALPPVLSESNKEVSNMPEDAAASDSTQDIPQLTVRLHALPLRSWGSDTQICRAR